MSNVTTTGAETQKPVRMEKEEGRPFVTPPVNIAAKNGEYLIEAEMPGVSKEGLEIMVEGNELTIIGRRKPETIEGELWHSESPRADYRRVFELGPDVDTSRITAELDQGILKLHLPKSEQAKPRKIEIK